MARPTDPATAALIASAIARKGVTRVHTGATVGFSDREYFLASRGDIDLKSRDVEAERADEQMREKFAEARHVGVSSDVAYLFATGQIPCCSCADLVSDEARAHARSEARRIEGRK